jgi:phospholipase/carboxylesterase
MNKKKGFFMLIDYSFIPQATEIKKLVIFLHGFGADGQDLISLAEMYSQSLPNTAFYSPTAPSSTPFNMGYQWFSDNNWTFRDKEGIENAKNILSDYIDSLVEKHKLEHKDVAIVSFSQGTMTSLYTLPRLKNKLAGLVAYSGLMMWHEELKDIEYNKFPILLYHGKNDPVVPFEASVQAEQDLEALGFHDVELVVENGLEHGISLGGIEKSSKFLKRILLTD